MLKLLLSLLLSLVSYGSPTIAAASLLSDSCLQEVCLECDCFTQWQEKIDQLVKLTNNVLDDVEKLKFRGNVSYRNDFNEMSEKIDQVVEILENRNRNLTSSLVDVLTSKFEELDGRADRMMEGLGEESDDDSDEKFNSTNRRLEKLIERHGDLELEVEDFQRERDGLLEHDLEGALELIKAAYKKAKAFEEDFQEIKNSTAEIEQICAKVDDISQPDESDLVDIDKDLTELKEILDDFESKMPELNFRTCGNAESKCGEICGGAGCEGRCGGLPCDGSVSKMNLTYDDSENTYEKVVLKEKEADELLEKLRSLKSDRKEVLDQGDTLLKAVLDLQETVKKDLQRAEDNKTRMKGFERNLSDYSEEITAKIKLINDLDFDFSPEEIQDVSDRINSIVEEIGNVDNILESSKDDLEKATKLKAEAEEIKDQAESAKGRVEDLLKQLEEIEKLQKEATTAINDAHEAIKLAKEAIEEMKEEVEILNEEWDAVRDYYDNIKDRVDEILKLYHQFRLSAEEIDRNLKRVQEQADGATKDLEELKRLVEEMKDTEHRQKRIFDLLERAQKLEEGTQKKWEKIEELNQELVEHSATINRLKLVTDNLNEDVEDLIEKIRRSAGDYGYGNCSP